MAKKSRAVRKALEMKARQSTPQPRRAKGLSRTFGQATDAVTEYAGKVPSSAIFWGLGALALGAAAVGAYIYRDRIVELYDDAMEAMDMESSDDSTETSVATPAAAGRKSKSNSSGLNQVGQH